MNWASALNGIRDSRKAGSLWGMMKGVGRVRKSIHQSWLAKGLGLGLRLLKVLREYRKIFLGKRPALFQWGQWHFHQDNAPVHNSILVIDYLTKIGIKTVLQPPSSRDLGPCDFWLFPKLKRTSMGPSRSCWKGTTSALQPGEITLSFMCVLSIKVPIRKKSGNLFNDSRINSS